MKFEVKELENMQFSVFKKLENMCSLVFSRNQLKIKLTAYLSKLSLDNYYIKNKINKYNK